MIKKHVLQSLIVASLAITIVGCATQKGAQPTTKRTKLAQEECEIKALEKSDLLRGYGIGISPDRQFARTIALENARQSVAKQVQVAMSGMFQQYNEQHRKDQTIDYQGKTQDMLQNLLDQSLKGSREICATTYELEGPKYEIHVCVELTNTDFVKDSYNKLTSDTKLKIDYDFDKYKKDFYEQLEKARASQN